MTPRFARGDHVLVRAVDPPWHTRVPSYVRGVIGEVVEIHGVHALPDDVVLGAARPARELVYAVRFSAEQLWGDGDHEVVVDLWSSYLVPREGRPS